jgi:hypothetical protein
MKSNLPKITLFLGIYNGEKYIDSLLEQIQSQENQKFTILVVDNDFLNYQNLGDNNAFQIWTRFKRKFIN